jgi:hypothetical protein
VIEDDASNGAPEAEAREIGNDLRQWLSDHVQPDRLALFMECAPWVLLGLMRKQLARERNETLTIWRKFLFGRSRAPGRPEKWTETALKELCDLVETWRPQMAVAIKKEQVTDEEFFENLAIGLLVAQNPKIARHRIKQHLNETRAHRKTLRNMLGAARSLLKRRG